MNELHAAALQAGAAFRQRPCRWIAPLVAITLLVWVGCGPGTDRLEISGRVTLDGEPLSGASIRFTSSGEKRLSSGAVVSEGEYYIPRDKGLPPGNYRVAISAPNESVPPVMVRPPGGGPGSLVAPERIPPEYSENSAHTIEVTADGDNQFDFRIESHPSK